MTCTSRGTFPGEGKRQATIGGFTYGHEPGKTVGQVSATGRLQ